MIILVMILFACVSANHLGLINAVENIIRHRLPIVNCARCLTFWATLAYGCYAYFPLSVSDVVLILAIAFLNAYLAVWLELGMGFVDTLYNWIYEKVYPTATDYEDSAVGDKDDPKEWMPELRQEDNSENEH